MSYRLFICSLVLTLGGCAAEVGKSKDKDLQDAQATITALRVENAQLKMRVKQYAKYCNPNTDKDCPIENVF